MGTESAVRRFETVFMISLPFTALYSGILTLGAATAIEVGIKGRTLRVGTAYQIAGASLALATSSWIAWRDKKAPKNQEDQPSKPSKK
jgi:hypothetical protein